MMTSLRRQYDIISASCALLDGVATFSQINYFRYEFPFIFSGPRSAIGRASDPYVRGPGFDTRSGNILSFLLPLFQEGQLSVTGESMCTKYWLTA